MRVMSVFAAAMMLLAILAVGIATGQDADPAPEAAEAQWTQAELDKGYVVFQHGTLQLLRDSHVPQREAVVTKVSCELARGESESIFIGIHSIQGPRLIDTWLEPTIDLDVKIFVRHMKLPDRLVYGNVIALLETGQTGGFWLTFRADADTPAGVHTGKIVIIDRGPAFAGSWNHKPTELELEVRVRPFELPRPRASFGAYFAQSDDPYIGYRKRFEGDAAWRTAIYADMAEHALTTVDFFREKDVLEEQSRGGPVHSTEHLGREIARAVEVGLVDRFTPVSVHSSPPADAEAQAAFHRHVEAERKRHGWPEFLYYILDEPRYPDRRRVGVRRRMEPYRRTPLRTITSLNMAGAYGFGDLFDVWMVFDGDITSELRAEAERLGADVWTYSHTIDKYELIKNRFYAGLYTWAHEAGGNWIWAYYRNKGFNSMVWCHNADNVMYPMAGYETRRDGIDDYRYLQLLEDTIAAKGESPEAAEAAAWLDALRARVIDAIPHKIADGQPLAMEQYDVIRAKAADYIERLGAEPLTGREPLRVPGLKDEAAAYRGKSIDACIAALSSDDVQERRAAAAALREHGEAAAPATAALVRQLDDPDVRIPALKALEHIGPAAASAAPAVGPLLDHPDRFIQLGARLTLENIAPD